MTGPDWPREWSQRTRYLPWQARHRRNGRVGKCPVDVRGRPVDPLDPGGWLSWEAACAQVSRGQAAGVGLVVTPALRLTVIDIDDCVRAEGLTADAQAVVAHFAGAYVEVSPSGRGLHVLVRGTCPPGWRRRPGVDLITTGFATVTGRAWSPEVAPRPDQQEVLRAWHAQEIAPPAPAAQNGWKSPACLPAHAPAGDWFIRAQRARNGHRFQALWRGELGGCVSPSEADLVLLLLLLYWQPQASDAELLELLHVSGRNRPKLHDAAYVHRTLERARRFQRSE